MLCYTKSNKNIKVRQKKNSIEQQVTNVTNFNLKRRKDFMCVEIRISVKWKKNRLYFSFIVSVYKIEKKKIIMDKKRILLPRNIVIL